MEASLIQKTNLQLDDINIRTCFFSSSSLISTYFKDFNLVGFFDELIPKSWMHKIIREKTILGKPSI